MSQSDNEVYFYYKHDLKRFWLDHGVDIIKRRNFQRKKSPKEEITKISNAHILAQLLTYMLKNLR